MDYSRRQSDPRRHLVGFSSVIVLHVVVIYALATGLGKKVVDVVRSPIETKVIEQVKKPPPPEVVVPPPPKLEAPPPPFIPPPEVHIATPPPPVQDVISASTPTPPQTPASITPITPPMAAAVPAPAPPATVSAAVVCSNYNSVMGDAGFPHEAVRQGMEKGDALIQFTLGANGELKDIRSIRASHPIFARNSMRIVRDYKCAGQGRDVIVQVPFGYKLE